MAFYSKRHYRLLSNGGPDTAAQIADRIARRKACERANAEMMAKFASLTAQNAQAAVDWQENRIRELIAGS